MRLGGQGRSEQVTDEPNRSLWHIQLCVRVSFMCAGWISRKERVCVGLIRGKSLRGSLHGSLNLPLPSNTLRDILSHTHTHTKGDNPNRGNLAVESLKGAACLPSSMICSRMSFKYESRWLTLHWWFALIRWPACCVKCARLLICMCGTVEFISMTSRLISSPLTHLVRRQKNISRRANSQILFIALDLKRLFWETGNWHLYCATHDWTPPTPAESTSHCMPLVSLAIVAKVSSRLSPEMINQQLVQGKCTCYSDWLRLVCFLLQSSVIHSHTAPD